jgi:cysteine synthase
MFLSSMHSSIIEAIGNTPLVELRRFCSRLNGRILAKLENLNPGSSKKDRIALQIIEDAEQAGTLRPGRPIVELTSGNTGTGLAIVSAVKGYPFVAVMSEGNSPERAIMMRALGAEVVLVPQAAGATVGQVSGDDLALVAEATQRIVKERDAFRADQFRLESNFRAHYLHTGPEIVAQSPYPIDLFCDFVGTGGTFAGCAAALKEANAATRCYIVEPAGAAVLSGAPVIDPRHRIQGGGYARTHLEMIRPEHINGYIQVTDEEAIACTRDLARIEGIFAGYSSGANLAAAVQLLQREKGCNTAVIIISDSGLKYVSTDLWRI